MEKKNATDRQDLGKRGEEIAAGFLEKKGYRIIRRNFRSGRGEIDIVARQRDDIVICEVKSLRHGIYGFAEKRLSRAQQKMIIRTTYAFLDKNPQFTGMGVRFDFLTVDFSSFPAEVTHYPEAFWQK